MRRNISKIHPRRKNKGYNRGEVSNFSILCNFGGGKDIYERESVSSTAYKGSKKHVPWMYSYEK